MKLNGLLVFASVCLALTAARAADATAPVDYTNRNSTYAPNGTIAPSVRQPVTNDAIQAQRVTPEQIEKKRAAVGDRRAAITVEETNTKNVRAKESQRPATVTEPMSSLNQRVAPVSTRDVQKPMMVAKFQDSLASASSSNMARFGPLDSKTNAKINRFVFRKNPPDQNAVTESSKVVPAAGGSVLRTP